MQVLNKKIICIDACTEIIWAVVAAYYLKAILINNLFNLSPFSLIKSRSQARVLLHIVAIGKQLTNCDVSNLGML